MKKKPVTRKTPAAREIAAALDEMKKFDFSDHGGWQMATPVSERSEAEHAMEHAANEIDRLRRQNEIMGAQLHVLHLFETVLLTKPHEESQGMAEDIAWKLRKIVADLKAKKEPGK